MRLWTRSGAERRQRQVSMRVRMLRPMVRLGHVLAVQSFCSQGRRLGEADLISACAGANLNILRIGGWNMYSHVSTPNRCARASEQATKPSTHTRKDRVHGRFLVQHPIVCS